MDLPVHGEQNEPSPIIVACYGRELLNACNLFAILLLYKSILPPIRLSSTKELHSLVTREREKKFEECKIRKFSLSGSHLSALLVVWLSTLCFPSAY